MDERLEVEAQIAPPKARENLAQVEVGARDELVDGTDTSNLTTEAKELIERLLAGKEPYGRDLKVGEPEKFSPIHINICTLRAAGFKGAEIAKILDLDASRVSIILRHPYGIKLVGALVPKNSFRVLDIRTRIDEYAGELLDRIYGKAMTEDDTSKVASVTFGLLDRAGYAVKPAASDGRPDKGVFSESTMKRLSRALDESREVDAVVMASWVPKPPPDQGALPADDVYGSSPRRLSDGKATGEVAPDPLSAAGGQR